MCSCYTDNGSNDGGDHKAHDKRHPHDKCHSYDKRHPHD